MLEENVNLLRQGLELLQGLDDEHYAKTHPVMGAGVGGHFRHVLDFYACFARDLTDGTIDYDDRPRNPQIESELAHARRVLEETCESLSRLDLDAAPEKIFAKTDAPADVGERAVAPSSLERELQFLASHTVHHYALVAVVLRQDGLPVPPTFGVAPSTLRYWKESGAGAN
jgi:uncharacterized damage-inducible protein DinB